MNVHSSSRPAQHVAFTAVAFTTVAFTTAAVALCACTWLPISIDRSARAPTLSGFGHSAMAITTASDPARRDFAQGMEQAYAFN